MKINCKMDISNITLKKVALLRAKMAGRARGLGGWGQLDFRGEI